MPPPPQKLGQVEKSMYGPQGVVMTAQVWLQLFCLKKVTLHILVFFDAGVFFFLINVLLDYLSKMLEVDV
ncbi:hypothetical protein ACQKWADRAFT_277205 [Trichoderma austrokoningii]